MFKHGMIHSLFVSLNMVKNNVDIGYPRLRFQNEILHPVSILGSHQSPQNWQKFKKVQYLVHPKLNSRCTSRVKNLITLCKSFVLSDPRLLQAHSWPIPCHFLYFLTQIVSSKVRRSTILEILPCHTGHETLLLRIRITLLYPIYILDT